MIESQKEDISQETSKNEIINSINSTNTTANFLNNNIEVNTTKPKVQQTKFEMYIINAYKKLVDFSENKPEFKKLDKKAQKELRVKLEEEEKININECENELRKSLEEIESVQNFSLNKNIIDKTSRIFKRNKINLSLLIGEIYIQLMNKKNIFDRFNQKNSLDKNIIINFINELIKMNSFLKNTYLCIKYENALYIFLENIIKEINFNSEQLNEINKVLQEHKAKKDSKKLNTKTSKEFLNSINEAFNKQNSLYGQYKIILNNSENIISLINNANLLEKDEINNFIQLGVLFLKLFFGKNCILSDKNTHDKRDYQKDKFIIKKLFDGLDDKSNGNIKAISGEKFFVDYDSDLEPMRVELCEIIIKYIEKFKSITNILELQYMHFVLLKRIYFYYFDKFEKEISLLFIQVLINLCLLKDNEQVGPVIQFINELLNSKEEKDANLKELLKQKIEEAKKISSFNFNPQNNFSGNLEKIKNEIIYIEQPNLNIGFFTDAIIESGDTLNLYVELSKPFGFIDLTLINKNNDINFSISNLTEGKTIYVEKKFKSDKGLKLHLFFTKPGIFKFEFDNSYSWVKKKNISYKITIFYPQYPKILENKISISKHQEILNNIKKIGGKKIDNENILQIMEDQITYKYNINEIKENIDITNSMIISSQIKILSIYIDEEKEEGEGKVKKYFYFGNENLEKTELTEENLENYIKENKNEMGTTIVNLFIITGNEKEFLINRELSIEKVLGFEPNIENENNNNSILFFIQYYAQAQLLYYLCNKIEEHQNTILINYTKFGGYQICLYVNGEIFSEVEDFKNLNKEESLEKNIEIICGCAKQFGKENIIKILVTDSIDSEEKNITTEKMSESVKKSLGIKSEEEGNYKIIELNKKYNKEMENYIHLLNLIE